LNIDEATSENEHRVLSMLVSFFSEQHQKVVVKHLASMDIIRVDSQTLHDELVKLLQMHKIPWKNVMSVLMDSCNVMRGSKSGLETRVHTGLAPHLLDIDGDSCHHAHNAAKKFSAQFDHILEALFVDIHTDFKWSTDLRDFLREICAILDIKFTRPERYAGTRWLSVYDVTVDTIRLHNAFHSLLLWILKITRLHSLFGCLCGDFQPTQPER
jgi:hypothetical protein